MWGWVANALFHEFGHAAVGWATGHLSVPTINPFTGHAFAHIGVRIPLAPWLIWAAIIVTTVRLLRAQAPRWIVVGAILYPALAWWPFLFETVILAGGHLGELAFAAWFLWRARLGINREEDWQRPLYGVLGAYLVGSNAILGFGLLVSPRMRGWYLADNQGMNDLIRLARDVWGTGLGLPAFLLGLIAILTPVITLLLAQSAAPQRSPD